MDASVELAIKVITAALESKESVALNVAREAHADLYETKRALERATDALRCLLINCQYDYNDERLVVARDFAQATINGETDNRMQKIRDMIRENPRGKRIHAIKAHREFFGTDLHKAKAAVDNTYHEMGLSWE